MKNNTVTTNIYRIYSLVAGISVIALAIHYLLTCSFFKLTYPCRGELIMDLITPLPLLIFIFVSCLPVKFKSRISIRKFTDFILLSTLLLHLVNFSFNYRIEYWDLYGVFSYQSVKALTLLFYAALYFLNKHNAKSVLIIIMGAFTIGFALCIGNFNRNLVLHERFPISIIIFALMLSVMIMNFLFFKRMQDSVYGQLKYIKIEHRTIGSVSTNETNYRVIAINNDDDVFAVFNETKKATDFFIKYDPDLLTFLNNDENAFQKVNAIFEEYVNFTSNEILPESRCNNV